MREIERWNGQCPLDSDTRHRRQRPRDDRQLMQKLERHPTDGVPAPWCTFVLFVSWCLRKPPRHKDREGPQSQKSADTHRLYPRFSGQNSVQTKEISKINPTASGAP
jgi:hypothetical protein